MLLWWIRSDLALGPWPGGEGEGRGGEGRPAIGGAPDTCHDVTRLMASPPLWDLITIYSPIIAGEWGKKLYFLNNFQNYNIIQYNTFQQGDTRYNDDYINIS